MTARLRVQQLAPYALLTYAVATMTFTAAMGVSAVLLMATAIYLRATKTWPTPNKSEAHLKIASIALAAACVASLLSAIYFPLIEAGRSPEVNLAKDAFKLWFLILPFTIQALVLSLKTPWPLRLLRTWILAAALVSVVGMVQFFTGWPRPQAIPHLPGRFHATLFFGHHLSTASILIFPLFIALASATATKDRRWRLIYAAASLLISVTLILTWSRALWIALPFGLVLWSLRLLKSTRARVIAVVAASLFALGAYQIPAVHQRMTHSLGQNERGQLWKANLHTLGERPILGGGFRKTHELARNHFESIQANTREFVGHAHNNVLEMLAGTGILGTLAWLAWSLIIFAIAWKRSRAHDTRGALAWGFFCAWVVFHLNGMTQVNFWEGKVMHQMMFATGLLLVWARSGGRTDHVRAL